MNRCNNDQCGIGIPLLVRKEDNGIFGYCRFCCTRFVIIPKQQAVTSSTVVYRSIRWAESNETESLAWGSY